MKKNLNQKLINLIEYYNLINANLLLNNTPINRNINNKTSSSGKTKSQKLLEHLSESCFLYFTVLARHQTQFFAYNHFANLSEQNLSNYADFFLNFA